MPHPDFSEVSSKLAPVVAAIVAAVRDRAPFILTGPPGVGKTMLARRVSGLLGPVSDIERTWLLADYQSLGLYEQGSHPFGIYSTGANQVTIDRPFRAPHHTISTAAMLGVATKRHTVTCPIERGLAIPRGQRVLTCCGKPESQHRIGELRLARFGVLFLDDLVDFPGGSIEPLNHEIQRMGSTAPLLVASGNPCPCGWHGSTVRECVCPEAVVKGYTLRLQTACARLKIVRWIDVPPLSLTNLRAGGHCPSTAELRAEIGVVS